MKRTLLLAFVLMAMASISAAAQTSTGTLTVTATVTGSINLILNSDASGVALSSGNGTNAATLAFGNIYAFGAAVTGVTRSTTATTFTVSTPVDVNVKSYNSASTGYTLTAKLGTADATNTWAVGGVTVTSASAATITSTGVYALTGSAQPVALTVPFTTANGTVISNTLNFTATAN
jgi:hypothetical protein